MKILVIFLLITFTNLCFVYGDTTPKLFINCGSNECYESFLRQELSLFDIVRDRYQADLQIFITQQETGNTGKMINVFFFPTDSSSQYKKDTISLVTMATDTDELIRTKLANKIKIGLLHYCQNTLLEEFFDISLKKRDALGLDTLRDRWRYWVFAPEINGNTEGETNFTWVQFGTELNIRRITNTSKFIVNNRYERVFNKVILDSALQYTRESYYIAPLYTKSLSSHLSLGALARFELDKYRNVRQGIKIAPALEYNVYPIDMNARKQLRIVYQTGLQSWKYYDTSVFNLLSEVRPYHKLSLITEYNQPWGSISSSVHASNYLDNFNQFRLLCKNKVFIRLVEGLAITVEGQFSFIKDQISLLKNELPEEVYLLFGQQLPTTFNYEFNFGFSYTFGSIHNNIVNPRMGSVD